MRGFIYITLGIIFICFSAYNLYGGYEVGSPLFSAFGFGGIVIGALITLYGVSQRSKKNPHENI